MIYDNIGNIELYKGQSAKLDKALDYIKSLAEAGTGFSEGKTVIEGDVIFAVSSSYETEAAGLKRHEAHIRYIDLQYMHEGSEKINVAAYGEIKSKGAYDDENDIYFADVPDKCVILMKKDDFAVFYPTDLHKLGITNVKPRNVKKVVVKIHV
jgi:YhcH/YjgK/YiaL family protein